MHRVLKQVEGISFHMWRELLVFAPLTRIFWSQAFPVCGCIVFVSSYDWLVSLGCVFLVSQMFSLPTAIGKSF